MAEGQTKSREWRRWAAGGGLAIALCWKLAGNQAQEASKTREFFQAEISASRASERADRQGVTTALQASAAACAQSALAQQHAAAAQSQAALEMRSMRGDVQELRRQQERLMAKLTEGGK